MYLELTPVQIRLLGLVTLEIRIPLIGTLKKTLYQHTIWGYKSPTIRKKMVDTFKKEEDSSPPEIDSFVDQVGGRVSIVTCTFYLFALECYH